MVTGDLTAYGTESIEIEESSHQSSSLPSWQMVTQGVGDQWPDVSY